MYMENFPLNLGFNDLKHLKDVGSPFAGCTDNLWSVDFHKSFLS